MNELKYCWACVTQCLGTLTIPQGLCEAPQSLQSLPNVLYHHNVLLTEFTPLQYGWKAVKDCLENNTRLPEVGVMSAEVLCIPAATDCGKFWCGVSCDVLYVNNALCVWVLQTLATSHFTPDSAPEPSPGPVSTSGWIVAPVVDIWMVVKCFFPDRL